MNWLQLITEGDAKRFAFLSILAAFIKMNWGSSIKALKYVVLASHTHNAKKVSDGILHELGAGIIPFGETISHLIICVVIWVLLLRIIKSFDLDSKLISLEPKLLIKENTLLRESLASSNNAMSVHIENLKQLTEQNTALERLQDRLTELAVVQQKHDRKQAKKSQLDNSNLNEQRDLLKHEYTKNRKKKRGPALRRPKQEPKF